MRQFLYYHLCINLKHLKIIEQNLNFVRKYFIPLSLGISMIGLAFLGLIGSLIGAAVAKKNTNPFENTTV